MTSLPAIVVATSREPWRFNRVVLPEFMREDGYTYYDAKIDSNCEVTARLRVHRRLRYVYICMIRKEGGVETTIGESIPVQWNSGLRMLGED